VPSIAHVAPLHVATWIEAQTRELSPPSVKQRLAALRHLFDWLVTGQVVPANPAASVRGPQHIVKGGKTPVLDPAEARAVLDGIDTATPAGLRDRALIALMVYSFARVGAALAMKVEDVNRRLWFPGCRKNIVAISPYIAQNTAWRADNRRWRGWPPPRRRNDRSEADRLTGSIRVGNAYSRS
jgi:site-specific recombinase XerD